MHTPPGPLAPARRPPWGYLAGWAFVVGRTASRAAVLALGAAAFAVRRATAHRT